MPIGNIDDLVTYFGKGIVDTFGLSKYSSEEYLFNWFKDVVVNQDGVIEESKWVIDVYHLVGQGFRGVKHIDTIEFESLDNYQKF